MSLKFVSWDVIRHEGPLCSCIFWFSPNSHCVRDKAELKLFSYSTVLVLLSEYISMLFLYYSCLWHWERKIILWCYYKMHSKNIVNLRQVIKYLCLIPMWSSTLEVKLHQKWKYKSIYFSVISILRTCSKCWHMCLRCKFTRLTRPVMYASCVMKFTLLYFKGK